jgi:hypothetical protein
MVMANPWAHSRTEDARDVPDSPVQQTNAYAVPPLSAGDAYNDEFGWAARLQTKPSTVETPSAQRLRTIPRYDYAARGELPSELFRQDIDHDREQRYSVEDQDANGWNELKGLSTGDLRWAPNPRLKPPPEPRITNLLSPRSYSFTRWFDQFNRNYDGEGLNGSARTFNGQHFSMADHRRNYEILGMRPTQSRRNTYRLEPVPWDVDVVDLPPSGGGIVPNARIQSLNIPENSRALRLM